jgi:hypothetical protein
VNKLLTRACCGNERSSQAFAPGSRGQFAGRLPFVSLFAPRGAVKRKISRPGQATKPLIFLGKNVFFLLARQA